MGDEKSSEIFEETDSVFLLKSGKKNVDTP